MSFAKWIIRSFIKYVDSGDPQFDFIYYRKRYRILAEKLTDKWSTETLLPSRRAFQSIIYRDILTVSRGRALASACTYSGLYMNILGTLGTVTESHKEKFDTHASRFPRKIISHGQFSQFCITAPSLRMPGPISSIAFCNNFVQLHNLYIERNRKYVL